MSSPTGRPSAPRSSGTPTANGEQVTLAIPSYNAAKYLPRVLEAAAQLTVKPVVTIVIDDGSKDATARIAEEHRVEVVRHQGNCGLGAARQTALKHCQTPWLAMVDSDVAVEPGWLGALLEVAISSGAAGVGGDLVESEVSSIPDRWRSRMMAQTHGGAFKEGVNLFGCNTLHRAAALTAVGGFNSRYTRAYEDIDISERLKKAGHKLVYTPTARCHHLRKDSLTSVLQAAYAWRYPRYEEQGVYQDLRTLMGKWVATFKEDFRELMMLLDEQRGELSFPCLVQLFANPVQDLSVLATTSRSVQLRSLAGIGTAMVLLVLQQALIPETLRQAVGLHLKPFVDILTGHLAHIALPADPNEELARMVNATINPWSSVLAFSPEHTARLLASAKLVG